MQWDGVHALIERANRGGASIPETERLSRLPERKTSSTELRLQERIVPVPKMCFLFGEMLSASTGTLADQSKGLARSTERLAKKVR